MTSVSRFGFASIVPDSAITAGSRGPSTEQVAASTGQAVPQPDSASSSLDLPNPGTGMRLHDFLEYWAREQPDVEFAVQGDRRLTYREAQRATNQLANAFMNIGLQRGDRIGVLAKNCIEYALVYFAASTVGVVPVPLNYRSAPTEWGYVLNDAGAPLLIAALPIVPAIDRIKHELGSVRQWVVLGAGATMPGWTPYAALVGNQSADPPESSASAEDDLYQLYTSGTTGQPKGAILTQRAVVANLLQIGLSAHRMGMPAERSLVVAPMLHAAVVWTTLAPIAWGGSLYIVEDFDAAEIVRILDEERIGYAVLVPTIIHACLACPDAANRTYRHLRHLHSGSAPIAEQTLRRAIEVFRCDVVHAYGLTESTAAVTTMAPGDYQRALEGRPELLVSAGRPIIGTDVRIVDEHDVPLPPGNPGEIIVRGPQVMRGYWRQPDATAEALRGGWLHTGDIGRLDADGYLYIQDRLKDVIVSGGVNVYPRMVERVLEAHPAVAEVAVVGVPDTHWGESVKAVVVLRQDMAATEQELITFCRDKLGGFQVPRSVDLVAELPRTATGKVLKRALREVYWAGQSRRVGGA